MSRAHGYFIVQGYTWQRGSHVGADAGQSSGSAGRDSCRMALRLQGVTNLLTSPFLVIHQNKHVNFLVYEVFLSQTAGNKIHGVRLDANCPFFFFTVGISIMNYHLSAYVASRCL